MIVRLEERVVGAFVAFVNARVAQGALVCAIGGRRGGHGVPSRCSGDCLQVWPMQAEVVAPREGASNVTTLAQRCVDRYRALHTK